RRRMPAVNQADHRLVVGGVGDDGGDEAFPDVQLRSGVFCGVPADGAFQVGGQFGQGELAVGQGAEGAEHDGGAADRGQALAADVADDQAGGAGGAGDGVQVAADGAVGPGGVRRQRAASTDPVLVSA